MAALLTVLFFILQSAIQVLGILYVSFSLFRFKLRSYLGEAIFISILIGGIIYFIRVYSKFGLITPMIGTLLLIVFMWLVIKIPVFYSTLMIIMGYLGIFVIESLLISLGQSLGILSFEKVQIPGTLDSTVDILLTNFILYFLGWWLYRRGFGFSFSFRPIKITGEAAGFLFAILAAIAVSAILNYSTIQFQLALTISAVVGIAAFCTLLYLSIRKEYKEHG